MAGTAASDGGAALLGDRAPGAPRRAALRSPSLYSTLVLLATALVQIYAAASWRFVLGELVGVAALLLAAWSGLVGAA